MITEHIQILLTNLLRQTHVLRLSGRDLKDFYYSMGFKAERLSEQCWAPREPATWFAQVETLEVDHASSFQSWWIEDPESICSGISGTVCLDHFVQPMASTLVMRGLNAVAADEAHLGLLDSAGVWRGAKDIGRPRLFLVVRFWIVFVGVARWRRRPCLEPT